MITRRDAVRGGLPVLLGAGSGCAGLADGPRETIATGPFEKLVWVRGTEGQRRGDLGDGRFLNPVFSGDHPDPAILKDGPDYYVTFSSFDAYPGLLIWRSRDLVNWTPIAPALRTPIGSVWASDLIKHDGRFYLYIPARTPQRRSIYVIHAERIEGPWSEPVDLDLPRHIDPGHAVGEDGRRYLFLSGGDRVRLAADGLSTDGAVEHVYDPWKYPETWTVEAFAPEGPKIFRRDGYFYLVTAVGGTAGPPTGHMVIIARSRSIHGPWENCPHNPIMRTWSAGEKWWSRGHATIIEGPRGDWWTICHGYENGFWTLGRQALLAPVRWRNDGWPEVRGRDLSRPMAKPLPGAPSPHGMALSDDFSTNRLGQLWAFYDPAPDEASRFAIDAHGLRLAAKGAGPADSSPLCFIAGDLSYEVETDISIDPDCEAGLLLFYSRRLYAGLGFNNGGLVMHRYGRPRRSPIVAAATTRMFIRIRNDRHIVTIHSSADGVSWSKFGVQMEVSGYHHNTDGDFLSLRPALYASGRGAATVRRVTYRAI
jgi:beta-xylosidase